MQAISVARTALEAAAAAAEGSQRYKGMRSCLVVSIWKLGVLAVGALGWEIDRIAWEVAGGGGRQAEGG